MNQLSIDARNMQCPQPLIMARKAIQGMRSGELLRIIIDNETARDNIMRFLRDNGMTPEVSADNGLFSIEVSKSGGSAPMGDPGAYCTPDVTRNGPVIIINHNCMGSGSEELGRVLLQACICTLAEVSPLPSAIVCYNGGVHVAAEGSPAIQALADLERRGVAILLCGTCIDYYELKGKLAVGTISNMHEILNRVSNSDRVVTL